jgi:hypothetical protein
VKPEDASAQCLESRFPGLGDRIAQILGPEPPAGFSALFASLPPRVRYIGPEAWLEALRRESEAKGVDSKAH